MQVSQFEYYEEVYYNYQTKGRRILSEEQLKQSFERQAKNYEELFGSLLPKQKNILCLDCGCGYGNFMYFLDKKGYTHVQGIDSDVNQINLALSLNLDARVGNALEEIETLKNVGLIAAMDFVEHLDKNSAIYFLESALKVLSPSGVLIIQCPCADGFTGSHDICNDFTHKWGASSNMLSQLLYTVGFDKVKIIDPSLPDFPCHFQRKAFLNLRKIARKFFSFALRIVGVKPPKVWANSQIAIAWKVK